MLPVLIDAINVLTAPWSVHVVLDISVSALGCISPTGDRSEQVLDTKSLFDLLCNFLTIVWVVQAYAYADKISHLRMVPDGLFCTIPLSKVRVICTSHVVQLYLQ